MSTPWLTPTLIHIGLLYLFQMHFICMILHNSSSSDHTKNILAQCAHPLHKDCKENQLLHLLCITTWCKSTPWPRTTLVHLDLFIPNAHYTRELPYCAYSFQLRSLQTFKTWCACPLYKNLCILLSLFMLHLTHSPHYPACMPANPTCTWPSQTHNKPEHQSTWLTSHLNFYFTWACSMHKLTWILHGNTLLLHILWAPSESHNKVLIMWCER